MTTPTITLFHVSHRCRDMSGTTWTTFVTREAATRYADRLHHSMRVPNHGVEEETVKCRTPDEALRTFRFFSQREAA